MNTPLKALFWKECRENLRWAMLALLALSLGLIYAWYHLFQQSQFQYLGAIWSSEDLVLTIMTPLIGLALGLMQILPELRRDQWACLVHRPASRTTLFWGKVLPGVCLYFGATILPLLGLAAWAAQPSHVPAPFDFRFTLAGWVAILAGLPFYFAGLLVALRPARWYGSRALPLLTAVLVLLDAGASSLFWPVVLVNLFFSALLLYAAWGSFVSGGEYQQQTKSARFALGLTLYPGTVAAAAAAMVLIFGAVNAVTRPGNQEGWQNEQKLDTQGHVYWHVKHFDSRGQVTTTVTDASGKPINLAVWENLTQRHQILDLNYLPQFSSDQEYFRYSDPTSYVLNLTSTLSDTEQTYWYYETAARQIVGYTVTAHIPSLIGYLGPNGFARSREQAGRFAEDRPEAVGFDGLHLLRFSKALYLYNPSAPVPSLRLLQSLPGGKGGTTLLSQTDQLLIVASGNQVSAYTSKATANSQAPTRLFTVSAPFATQDLGDLQIAMAQDRSRFFLYDRGTEITPSHLVTMTGDGRIIKSETLPSGDRYTAQKPQFAQAAPAFLIPPAALSAATLYGYIGHRLHWSSADGLWNTLTSGGAIVFFSVLGGLIAAMLAWLISRRLGDGRQGQIAWAVGGFWLGGYGVLLLLALRAWPARLPCSNCGRPRVVDREECEHCGAAWARTKRDGTEIFDADMREDGEVKASAAR